MLIICIIILYKDFVGHTGPYVHHWADPLLDAVTLEELEWNHKKITLVEVKEWIERHGGIEGRLRWFEAYAPNSPIHHKVAKPLDL